VPRLILPSRLRQRSRSSRAGSRSAPRVVLGSALSLVLGAAGIAAVPAAQAKESTCPGRTPITKDLKLGAATLDLKIAWTCRSVDVWGWLDNPSSQRMTAFGAIAPQGIPLFDQSSTGKDVPISSGGFKQVNSPGGAGTIVIALGVNPETPHQAQPPIVWTIARRP
jgi:hypothetical protein